VLGDECFEDGAIRCGDVTRKFTVPRERPRHEDAGAFRLDVFAASHGLTDPNGQLDSSARYGFGRCSRRQQVEHLLGLCRSTAGTCERRPLRQGLAVRLRRIHRRGVPAAGGGERNRRDMNARTALAAAAFALHRRRFSRADGSILNVHTMARVLAARSGAGCDARYRAAALHHPYFANAAVLHALLRGLVQRGA
jgi:hypothetical protein